MFPKLTRPDLLALGLFCWLFFLTAGVLVLGVPNVFNSPDENANAVFTETMRAETVLSVPEPLNQTVGNILGPRSVVPVNGSLVPVSFLGLPVVYGLLAKVFSQDVVLMLTPILAVLAVFAWRSIVETIFRSRLVALIAALAVLFHPGFWYYAGRTMMHNVGFVSLLILGTYFSVVRPFKQHEWINWACSGVLLALAVTFRTFEVIWVAPAILVCLGFFWKQISLKQVSLFIVGLSLVAVPFLMVQSNLYGSVGASGYTVSAEVGDPTEAMEEIVEPPASFTTAVTPFGVAPKSILRHAWYYSVALFPWMSMSAFLGFLLFWAVRVKARTEWNDKPLLIYTAIMVGITLWLWIVYGSWSFTDNPDPKLVTIGTSYIRYWLPIFVMVSPFFAQLIVRAGETMKTRFARNGLVTCMLFLMIGLNVHPVFFADDGLMHIRYNLFTFQEKQEEILRQTEDDAIVIVDRADKFVWPDRRVVQPLRDDVTYAAMPMLAAEAPLYYFGITFGQQDLDYLNETRLEGGLVIESIVTLNDETLYRIYLP